MQWSDHERYQNFLSFLKGDAYPVIKRAVGFFTDWLTDDGTIWSRLQVYRPRALLLLKMVNVEQ